MQEHKVIKRSQRKFRIRKRVSGVEARPRVSVFRSNEQIYAQIIDDVKKVTLVAASSLEKPLIDQIKDKRPIEIASEIGKVLAKRAKEKGISKVVFDRSGYAYHGRVKALAEGARSGGLEF